MNISLSTAALLSTDEHSPKSASKTVAQGVTRPEAIPPRVTDKSLTFLYS